MRRNDHDVLARWRQASAALRRAEALEARLLWLLAMVALGGGVTGFVVGLAL